MPLAAGFDIGGTNARLSLYDDQWEVLASGRETVRDEHGPVAVAQTMHRMLAEALESADAPVSEIDSVGVGLAGQLDATGECVINAPNLGWRDVAFARLLSETFDDAFGTLDIAVVNDLSALLWGEYCDGAVSGISNVLAVYVGTGVGGAILADDQLINGTDGKAGEIGHSKVVPGGRLCGCGERGCVEAYAGGVHLEQRAAAIAERQDIDVFRSDEQVEVDLKRVDELVGEVQAFDELWETATDYLALVLANACTLLNPAALLLGGGVLNNLDDFRGRVLTKTPPLVLEAARQDLEIRFPKLGDEAGMLGAATLAVERKMSSAR